MHSSSLMPNWLIFLFTTLPICFYFKWTNTWIHLSFSNLCQLSIKRVYQVHLHLVGFYLQSCLYIGHTNTRVVLLWLFCFVWPRERGSTLGIILRKLDYFLVSNRKLSLEPLEGDIDPFTCNSTRAPVWPLWLCLVFGVIWGNCFIKLR